MPIRCCAMTATTFSRTSLRSQTWRSAQRAIGDIWSTVSRSETTAYRNLRQQLESAFGFYFIRRLLVEPGRDVTVDQALVESDEPTLKSGIDVLQARVAELETRLATERFTDRVKADITTTELGQARAELATSTDRAKRLIARSRGEGIFAIVNPQDVPGRFVK